MKRLLGDILLFLLVQPWTKACKLGDAKYGGCSEAPSCEEDCREDYTASCERTMETICRGCFKGPPNCESGWTIDSGYGNNFALAKNKEGAGCTASCCRRGCTQTRERFCPRTGCCKTFSCPSDYKKKDGAEQRQGQASTENCCDILTHQCTDGFECPPGWMKKADASEITGAASKEACCDACAVTAISGSWIYKFDGNAGDSYSLEEGVSSTSETSFTLTNEWSRSMSVAVSAGFTFCSGFTLGKDGSGYNQEGCGNIGIEVTKTTGRSQSQEYSSSFAQEKSASTAKTIAINHDGVALWQFEFYTTDICSRGASVSTSQFAFSPAQHIAPHCLPGYCDSGNHPKAMCCSCKAAPAGQVVKMPNATECPTPECSKEMKASIVLGSSVEVSIGQDIPAGDSVSVPCGSVNPDYSGNIIVTCSAETDLMPDASGCFKQGSSPSPSPSPSPQKQCICGAGVAATGDLCPATGDIKCVQCHQGYILDGEDCVRDDSGSGDSENQCICGAGVAATGDLCPATGDTKCVQCHQGYVLNGADCVRDNSGSSPSPAPGEGSTTTSTSTTTTSTSTTTTTTSSSTTTTTTSTTTSTSTSTTTTSTSTSSTTMSLLASTTTAPLTSVTSMPASPSPSQKQCICGSGVPASGALCPETGSIMCISCHPGFVLWEDMDCIRDSTDVSGSYHPRPFVQSFWIAACLQFLIQSVRSVFLPSFSNGA